MYINGYICISPILVNPCIVEIYLPEDNLAWKDLFVLKLLANQPRLRHYWAYSKLGLCLHILLCATFTNTSTWVGRV